MSPHAETSSPSIRWLTFPLGLVFILILGLGLPILGSAVSAFAFPEWRWADRSFHTLIEILGGLLALSLGTLLFRHQHIQTKQLYYWVGCGLIGMGILDVFHSLVEVGKIFVWFHSTATFVGGMLFMVGWWQRTPLPSRLFWKIPISISLASILFGTLSLVFSDLVPMMVVEGEFTVLAKGLNILGGLGFFVAATRFIQIFRKQGTLDEWLFAIHCTLFGSAGVLFEISTLWDAGWWWWHGLRLLAYGTGLQCIFAFSQMKSSDESLPHRLDDEKKDSTALSLMDRKAGTWLPMIIVIVTVISLTMGGMTLYLIHDHFIKNEGEALVVMASNVSQQLEQNIIEREGDIELLTKAPVFQQPDTQAMSAYLQTVAQTNETYLALSFINSESIVVASTSHDLLSEDFADEPIVVSMQQAPRFHFEDVGPLSYFKQTLGFALAAPVLTSEGQYRGMILGHVSIAYLMQIFKQATGTFENLDENDSSFEWQLLRHDGLVLVDSILQEAGRANLQALGLPSAQFVQKNRVGYVEEQHLRRKIPVITSYARTHEFPGLSGIYWGILVRKDQAEVLASVTNIQSKLSLIGMGVIFPLIGLLLLSAHRLQTAQARAIQAMKFAKASEAQNRLILNSAGEGIWGLDLEGKTTFVNPAAAHMLGYDPAELLGTLMHAMVHHTKPDGSSYPREDCPMYAAYMDGAVHQIDDEVLWRKDGTSFPIEYTSTPIHSELGELEGAVVTFKDISYRLEAEQRFRHVFESSPSGMIMINEAGRIVLSNRVLEWQFGYQRNELLEQAIECLVPERFRGQHSTHRANFFSNPSPRAMGGNRELFGLRKDGSEFPIEIGLNPHRTEEGMFVLASVVDITARKLEEATLVQYMEELKRSNQELDDFAHIAAHDLKEPLRGIFNYSTILLEDYGSKLDEDAQAKCETLLRLSERMEGLIDSLHYFSRAGRTELAKGKTDLQHVLAEILDSIDFRLKECGVDILIPRSLPTVTCDSVRTGEILRNLITNAMKYNDKDEKWIEIGYLDGDDEEKNIDRNASRSPVFYVRDNGIGIREKHLPNIFRIFKRLHGRDKFGGGTGAGLTITKKLVERHGGSVWVESTYGEGTTFYFTLEKSQGMKSDVGKVTAVSEAVIS